MQNICLKRLCLNPAFFSKVLGNSTMEFELEVHSLAHYGNRELRNGDNFGRKWFNCIGAHDLASLSENSCLKDLILTFYRLHAINIFC